MSDALRLFVGHIHIVPDIFLVNIMTMKVWGKNNFNKQFRVIFLNVRLVVLQQYQGSK